MKGFGRQICSGILLMGLCLGCALPPPPLKVSSHIPISQVFSAMVAQMRSQYDFRGRSIQVSDPGFFQQQTLMHLPFSSFLNAVTSAELTRQGGRVSLQEMGENPLRLVGSYLVGEEAVLVTLRLRQMGLSSGQDLAVVSRQLPREMLAPAWFVPGLSGVAHALVRKLELVYQGGESIAVQVRPFSSDDPSHAQWALGEAMEKYLRDALAASSIFKPGNGGPVSSHALLRGAFVPWGSGWMFHAALVRTEDQVPLAGAEVWAPDSTVPEQMRQPGVRSLEGLCRKLVLGLEMAPGQFQGENSVVFIPPLAFHDRDQSVVGPLNGELISRLKKEIPIVLGLSVAETFPPKGAWLLRGSYGREGENLRVSMEMGTQVAGRGAPLWFRSQAYLGKTFYQPDWFQADLDGHLDYAMVGLERAVERNSALSPPVSVAFPGGEVDGSMARYLYGHFQDRLGRSHVFTLDFPGPNPGGPTPVLLEDGAAGVGFNRDFQGDVYSLRVQHRQRGRTGVDVEIGLVDGNGQVQASSRTTAPLSPTEIALLGREQGGMSPSPSPGANLVLSTQKGRGNPSFFQGEGITFFVRSDQDLFLQLFNRDATGNVYRIYPNGHDNGSQGMVAHQTLALPQGIFDQGFQFKVGAPLGEEQVVAFASDVPLPDIPGADILESGMLRVGRNLDEIQAWFEHYTRARGISLAVDTISLTTRERP
ncbi:MAG: DUF4384 domain-containing protein [Desulfobacterales bacterium]|nr:DUF4384 domain-containing protein [Desulfobacterales bacterium]